MIKVKPMRSSSGAIAINQYMIRSQEGLYFQSYDVIISFIDITNDKIYLDENYWNYSKTTSKYRNIFLGMDKKQTRDAIKSGKIILTDLNSNGGYK